MSLEWIKSSKNPQNCDKIRISIKSREDLCKIRRQNGNKNYVQKDVEP